MSAKGGFGKLQAFCATACEWDYLWAWSDTCCIDKDSSAEVQETIGSMFAWYRRSALTIVYLPDVLDTGSVENSEWFKRGWTLQGLPAPKRMLFYTPNWPLYKNLSSSNHKADSVMLEELKRATGIESRFLTNLSPGMDDARSRLQWGSLRRTTRPEDIAYSLSSCLSCMGNLLRMPLAGSWPKSYPNLQIFRFWIGSGRHRHFIVVSPLTSPRIIYYHRLNPNLAQKDSYRRVRGPCHLKNCETSVAHLFSPDFSVIS
ncbi:hypothetical protein BKA82DRAFT_306521 [Pisolithus tinctorius]|uniref:Heterokaryon incompatibility domain-containing protein n=1 Tax=Pisolithus tinctorius Marx 270 TaxID=870435 RepID=A0A0C3KHM5_PISTI|nr:hypothetical protein BKA82DRAFT_306521 [Pisolithus tinctorius]KIO09097.1 hypothetical protein M404DRAFT_306521 [Pisolithus tinctorius Marx 270]